ncbi:tRNA lysidine(34) synthetase TilS [Brevundimonas aveniformis]|uniref:tRNA lysidine(34) synthetase TilS n=1 Tax=Brevundimonas aveniformis TaxID=370977 RepID=UPI0004018081|nr:tRNA lysidine(34) synthetase TilS [Brevundimonas aveniformis]
MRLRPDWVERVQQRLDHYLTPHARAPVTLGVSGGGDSMALMHVAADWTRRRKRRLVVLSLDHGLSPHGPAWNDQVARAATALGLDWLGLSWDGAKPHSGLAEAARQARHALLAEAARAGGAKVILLGHTLDDLAEADWMRARGTPLGQMQVWSPSPAWPEGRGLMLLRPMLDVRREALRAWLQTEGISWVDDPANADLRFQRSRARAAQPSRTAMVDRRRPSLDLEVDTETGVIRGPITTPWLGQALASAAGRAGIPSSSAVERLRHRLVTGASAGVLNGARVQAQAGGLTITRERGREGPPTQSLVPGDVQVWDGRFAFEAAEPGWAVGPAGGHRARLSCQDRTWLGQLPAPARPYHPVLFRDGDPCPVLAHPTVKASCLVPDRLRLATRQAKMEGDL